MSLWRVTVPYYNAGSMVDVQTREVEARAYDVDKEGTLTFYAEIGLTCHGGEVESVISYYDKVASFTRWDSLQKVDKLTQ
jgi:hypothetical protein